MGAEQSDAELLSLCSAIEHDINTAPDMPLMPSLDDVRVLIGAARRAVKMRGFIADYQFALAAAVRGWGKPHEPRVAAMLKEFLSPEAAGKDER